MMKKRETRWPLFLIPLILLACNKSGTEVALDEVAVEVRDDSIRVTNNNSSTIHFLIVESEIALLIDWAPTCDAEAQNQIAPGKSSQILYENIFGFHQDCKIMFYWWTCYNSRSPGLSPGPIHTEIIQTP